MRRLSLLAALPIVALTTSWSCNEHPVEHCVAGQGITLDVDPVPRLGPAHAPVELVMFGDFQCPATAAMAITLDAFALELDTNGQADRFQLRFHHLPIEALHDRARAAAIAGAAAHRQGDDAFWSLYWHLFKSSDELTDEDIMFYAELAGLDLDQFAADLADPVVEAVVDRDLELSDDLGLGYTPSLILCGVPVEPRAEEVLDNLEALVDAVP
jgi:protein-disulfide isomerase